MENLSFIYPTSITGPDASAKSPPVCGSRNVMSLWLSWYVELDTSRMANENPTTTPNISVVKDFREANIRVPVRKTYFVY